MEQAVPVRSLKKALDLLDLIIEADLCETKATLGNLAKRMNLRANSVHNLLKTMAACGYVEKTGHGIYVQGLKCRQLGRMNRLTAPSFLAVLQARLTELATREGESCLLAVLVNGARVVVSRVQGTQTIQVSHAMIEDRPFFSRATGRILAAIATEDERRQIVARQGMPGALWDDISSEAALKAALDDLRRQGWARVNTAEGDLIGLACPVFGPGGRPWGAMGIYAPAFRSPPKRCARLLKALLAAAAELSPVLPERPE